MSKCLKKCEYCEDRFEYKELEKCDICGYYYCGLCIDEHKEDSTNYCEEEEYTVY